MNLIQYNCTGIQLFFHAAMHVEMIGMHLTLYGCAFEGLGDLIPGFGDLSVLKQAGE